MVNIFVSPSDAFHSIHEHSRWALHCAVIVIASVCIGYLLMPFIQKIVFHQLIPQMGIEKANRVMALSRHYDNVQIILVPLLLVLKWLLLAVVLYYSAVLLNAANPKFKAVFALVVHAEYILLVMGIVNIVLLNLKDPSGFTSFTDLQPIVGADILCRMFVHDIAVLQFLRSINIFNVWYLVLLAVGVSKICGIAPWKSSLIILIIWAGTAGMQFTMSMN